MTTTSYAILGVLAMRPWPAYELTNYMRTSAVRFFWPRTESRLYAEPKNLIAHGLAEASSEYTGRRRRTVYRITKKGRAALAAWLGAPAARAETQDEAMLKMLLADYGTLEQLRSNIRRAMEDLLEQVSVVEEIAARIERGEAQFPERVHVNALAGRWAAGTLRERFDFLKWADAWAQSWEETDIDEKKREVALGVAAAVRAELRQLDDELRGLLGRDASRRPDANRRN